jgi:hypothetical protein
MLFPLGATYKGMINFAFHVLTRHPRYTSRRITLSGGATEHMRFLRKLERTYNVSFCPGCRLHAGARATTKHLELTGIRLLLFPLLVAA